MKIVLIECDLCKKRIPMEEETKLIPVRFMTEQTEGRAITPYLYMMHMHVCAACNQRLIHSLPIEGHGAQGHNTYKWSGDE